MGKSRDGSVGSYSSGNSGGVGNVLGKYGANDTDGKIAKVPLLLCFLSSFFQPQLT